MDARKRRAHDTILRIAANMVRGTYQDAAGYGIRRQKTVSIARLERLMERDADTMREAGAGLADALKVLVEGME